MSAAETTVSFEGPIVVTGASGFVGASVVRRLIDVGRDVHLFVRPDTDMWRIRDVVGRATVHPLDIRDARGLTTTIRAVMPTAVIHLATYGAYADQTSAKSVFDTNVLGSLNLFEAAIDSEVRLVVNAGSSSEYGASSHPMSESDAVCPDRMYGVAKVAQSLMSAVVGRRDDISTRIVTLRFFSVYGPWERADRLIPRVVLRALSHMPIEMASPQIARDFVFIDDVVDAVLRFDRLAAHSGEILNVGTGIQSTLADVVRFVLECTGTRSEVRWSSLPDRPWDATTWVADTRRTATLLGWQAEWSLHDGIRRVVEWVRANRSVYGDE